MTISHSPVQVVAAVLVDSLAAPTRFLGARRSYPSSLAGRYEFPGGKIEAGEEPVAALRREIREELGVEIELGGMLTGPEGDGGWRTSDRFVMRVWWARALSEPAAGDSHDTLCWVGAADAESLPWLEGDVAPVRAVVAALGRGPLPAP